MMLKNTLIKYSVIIFLILFTTRLVFSQQYPVKVNVNVVPPFSTHLSDYVGGSDKVFITLTNTDIELSQSVKLIWSLTGDNGVAVESKPSTAPDKPIVLDPGQSLTMTQSELRTRYEGQYTRDDFNISGLDVDALIESEVLPEGIYTLCARALDFETNDPLSPDEPMGCSKPINIQIISAPQITYPQDEATVKSPKPQFINFTWTPVNVQNQNIRYKFKIIDITNLNVNPYDAMEGENFLYFKKNIRKNVMPYDVSKPLLEDSNKYAVQVQAYDVENELKIKNEGKSEIVVFTFVEQGGYQTQVLDSLPDPDEILPEDSVGPIDMGCGAKCTFDMTNVDKTPATTTEQGDTIKVGYFKVLITNLNYVGNTMKESGGFLFATDLIKQFDPSIDITVGIPVAVNNVKVNKNNRMIDGTITIELDAENWIDESWMDTTQYFNLEDVTNKGKSLEDIYQEISGSNTEISPETRLPVALDSNFMQIVGLNFTPTKARMNLFGMIKILDDKNKEKYLSFGVKNICINPGGLSLSEDEAYMQLLEDVQINLTKEYGITLFKGKDNNDLDEGTYLSFDCNGFREVSANGIVKLTNLLVAEDEKGNLRPNDTVAASFRVTFRDWSNWIAKLDFTTIPAKAKNSGKIASNRIQYQELKDFTFVVRNAILDHSEKKNAQNMAFPENYQGKQNASWEGVLIRNIDVLMPRFIKEADNPNDRVKFGANDLLLDMTGITGSLYTTDILNMEEGRMGPYAAGFDSIGVDILQNHLEKGKITGGIKLPITDSLSYFDGSIDFTGNTNKYTFYFRLLEKINIPMWVAEAKLDSNSTLNVDVKGSDREAYIKARLHGAISLTDEIEDVMPVNFIGIRFQDLVLENRPPHINVSSFGFQHNAPNPQLAGFKVANNGIDFLKRKYDLTLRFKLNFDLTNIKNAVSGNTEFRIKAELHAQDFPIEYYYEGYEIDSINLDADMGFLDVRGKVGGYYDDDVFGDGFKGTLRANFLGKKSQLTAKALYGNKKVNEDTLNYWYVDGKKASEFKFMTLSSPISVYGFGGGAYSNLKRKDGYDPSELKGSPSGGNEQEGMLKDRYIPQKGFMGIKGKLILGLYPTPQLLNADVGMTAYIDKEKGSLKKLSLDGDAYSFVSLTERNNPPFHAGVSVTYDFNENIFDLYSELDIKVPPVTPVLQADGKLRIHVDSSYWYLKAGTPKDPMEVSIGIKDASITSEAYFMMGKRLPPARLPQKLTNYISDYEPSFNSAVSTGNGVAAGFKISSDFEKDLKICTVFLDAILGADVAVMDYSNCKCNGRSDFGINKWYANGAGYLYAYAGFRVKKTDVLSTKIGSIVEAGLPNPTGVKGHLKATFTFLGKDFDISEGISVGVICDMEPVEGEMVTVKSPLEEMDFISDIKPANESQNVDLYTEPVITFSKDVYRKGYSKKLELTYSDGQGGTQTSLYRFNVSISWQKLYEGEWYDMDDWQTTYDRDKMKLTLTAMENLGSLSDPDYQHFMLDGNATYRVKAKVTVEEKKSADYWETATYSTGDMKGQPISDTLSHKFTTGPTPDFLPEDLISYTVPFDRQRYFTVGDHSKGVIQLTAQLSTIFDSLTEQDYVIKVQFTNMNDRTDIQESEVSMHVATTRLIYNIPALQKESLYKMELIADKESQQSDSGDDDGSWKNNMVNNDQESNFEYTGGENYTEQAQEMAGYLAQAAEAKVLHRIHFGTSKYNTMAEKINAIQAGETEVKSRTAPNAGVHALSNFNGYDEIHLTLKGGEPFDVFDLQGMAENPQAGIGGPNIDVSDDIDNLPLSTWQRQVHEDVFDDRHFEDANCLGRPPERFDAGIEAFEFEHVNYNNYGYNTYSDWMSTDQTSNILYVDPPLTEDEIESGEASSGNAGFQKPYGSFDITDFSMGSLQTGDESGSSGSGNLMPVLEIVYKLDYQAKIIYDRLTENYYCDEDELPEYPDLTSGEIIIDFKGSGGHFSDQSTSTTKELHFQVSP